MTTYELNEETMTLVVKMPVQFQDDGECGNIDTPDAGDLNTAARECAARRGWAMEGGRYPIRSKELHGEADLAKAIKAVGRGGGSHDEIRRHIIKRAKSLGLSDRIPENWSSSGDNDDSRAASGITFPSFADGSATTTSGGTVTININTFQDRDDEGGENAGSQHSIVASAVTPHPSAFASPGFTRPTPLTVDGERVFGHLASWNECHLGIGDRCVTAPRSATNYAYFKTGEVVCQDGSRVPVGKITLGTGHADPKLGLIPATEHYDNTGTVVAVVNVGEDQFGIWVNGVLVPGLDEQRLAELRRSPLSGDWRRTGGNLELVAALAVNAPGFPVLRASADEELETLLAAGIVTEAGEEDPAQVRAQRWQKIQDLVRQDRVKALLGG